MDIVRTPPGADNADPVWPPRELGSTFVLKPAPVTTRSASSSPRRPHPGLQDGERIRNGIVGLAMAFRRLREVLE